MTSAGLTSSMTGTVTLNLINYLRGDATNEATSASTSSPTAIYRARTTRLGDIVSSTPVFVKDTLDLNYEKLPSGTAGQGTYRAFVDGTGTTPSGGKKQRAEGVLFVGANDGMLHAFRDGTYTPAGAVVTPGGFETFAYVPKALLPTLNQLADKAYVHRYFVDGPNIETDAYFTGGSPHWANLVLGTTGAGAGVSSSAGVSPRTAVYAIDVTGVNTSATSLNASSVLWEVSSSDSNFSELGHVLTDVQTGPTLDGKWVAIFGNGYESASCQARLYVVNLETGARIREINTGAGDCASAKNGLGGVRVVRNANQQIIGVYAGDLQGNRWKFNLNNSSSAAWGIDLGGSPLFTAGAAQPITAAPTVVPLSATSNPKGAYMVVAGTGKFYEVGDIKNPDQQSLYGILDPVAFGASTIPSGSTLTDKTLLVPQTIGSAQTAGGKTYFAISTNAVDYVGKTSPTVILPRRGWYIDFPKSGQRLVYPMELLSGRYVAADTISPANVSLDPCSKTSGGTGFLYLVDALTGAGPTVQILDTNGDGNVDSSDLLVSGLEGKADGRNVSIKVDKKASGGTSGDKYVICSGEPECTLTELRCIVLGTCGGPQKKIKSREWRQLFMR
jgi:type IV pilus assembly protein PilY1